MVPNLMAAYNILTNLFKMIVILFTYIFQNLYIMNNLVAGVQQETNESLMQKYNDLFKLDINKYTGFDFKLMRSFFDNDIEFLGVEKYTELFESTQSFNYFNHFHFYVEYHRSYYMICFSMGFSKILNLGSNLTKNYYRFFEFKERGKKRIKFIDLYKISDNRHIYDKLIFQPDYKIDKSSYNLFTGFKHDDKIIIPDMNKIQIFLDHIRYLCELDNQHFDYLIKWCANIVQQPWIKQNKAIILYGDLNNGRDKLNQLLSKIFENYSCELNNFNIGKANEFFKTLLVYSDYFNNKTKKDITLVENMIMRHTKMIQFKGAPKYEVPDYCNFIFGTNNNVLFDYLMDNQLFYKIVCSPYIKPVEHYNELTTAVYDDECIRHFYYYLKNLDVYVPYLR